MDVFSEVLKRSVEMSGGEPISTIHFLQGAYEHGANPIGQMLMHFESLGHPVKKELLEPLQYEGTVCFRERHEVGLEVYSFSSFGWRAIRRWVGENSARGCITDMIDQENSSGAKALKAAKISRSDVVDYFCNREPKKSRKIEKAAIEEVLRTDDPVLVVPPVKFSPGRWYFLGRKLERWDGQRSVVWRVGKNSHACDLLFYESAFKLLEKHGSIFVYNEMPTMDAASTELALSQAVRLANEDKWNEAHAEIVRVEKDGFVRGVEELKNKLFELYGGYPLFPREHLALLESAVALLVEGGEHAQSQESQTGEESKSAE